MSTDLRGLDRNATMPENGAPSVGCATPESRSFFLYRAVPHSKNPHRSAFTCGCPFLCVPLRLFNHFVFSLRLLCLPPSPNLPPSSLIPETMADKSRDRFSRLFRLPMKVNRDFYIRMQALVHWAGQSCFFEGAFFGMSRWERNHDIDG